MLSLYLDVLVANNMETKAREILRKKVERNTQDVDSRFMLLTLLSKDGANKSQVIKLYNEIIITRQNEESAYIAFSQYLIKHKFYFDAKKNILNVRKVFPKSYIAEVLEGDLAAAEGNKHGAAKFYLDAYRKKENRNLLVKVVQLLNTTGKQKVAIKLLLEEIQSDNSNVARMLLAGIYLSESHSTKAEKQYRAVLKKTPNHYIALNDLAWLLSQNDKNKEALVLAEKAYSIAPDSIEVKDTYVVILKRLGITNKAEKVMAIGSKK